ncbi:MAG: hypothetical protein HY293_13915 [Planctomycetes bacterium]|nr:hypothetical protein [Planctomycetota bacterium]
MQDQPSRGIFKNLSADLRMGLDIRRVPFQYGDLLKIRLRAENRGKKRIRCARCSLAAVEYAQAGGQDRQTRSELHYFTVRFPDPGAESQDYAMEVAIPAWPIPFSGRYSRVYFWFSAELDIARAFNASMEVPIEIE